MATYNLTGQKIKNTYGQLAQVNDSNKLVDGLGNEKQIVTSSIVNFPTEVSRSAAEAGFGAGGAATWPISGTPSGIVSGAAQLPQIATNTADIASLTAATSSYLTSLPSGVVSSSAQVDLSLATGVAANATSASYASNASTADSATSSTTSVSASHAVYADSAGTATSATTATSASHAVQADSSLTANSATTASYAVTASHVPGVQLAGLVAGTGVDSIKSADYLTTPRTASADDAGAIAIGQSSQASRGSVAIGQDAKGASLSQTEFISIGSGSRSSLNSVAIGRSALCIGTHSIAIGNQASVIGNHSIHISLDDFNIEYAGTQTINIGKDINNQNGYSTAIGHNITNTGTGGNVLIGRSIVSANDYSIGIGEGVNVAQGGVAIGQNANNAYNGVAVGNNARTGNSYAAAYGLNTNAGANAAIVVGADAGVSSDQAIVIGVDTTIDGSSRRAVALGQDADIATSEGGITLGGQTRVTGATGGIAIGWGSSTTGAYGIAIGSGSKVTTTDEININDTWTYDGSERTTIGSVLNLPATHPLPTGQLGDIATSGSALYFHNGTSWAAIS
jgi:hypothetical protein